MLVIVNHSLLDCCESSNVNPFVLNKFRPVSNISFQSKILENLVFRQLNDLLNSSNIFEKC